LSYRLVIFDWDGTLVDSLDQVTAAVAAAIARAGLPARSAAAIRDVIGLGAAAGIARLYPDDPDGARHALVTSEALPAVRERLEQPAPLFPAVADLLDELADAGHVLALATAKSRAGLERDLDATGLRPCLSASRCADDGVEKPAPAIVHALLAATGMRPREAVVVGDTLYDLQMAAWAGVDAIAVTWGAHTRDRLLQGQPSAIVSERGELRDLLLAGR